MSAWFLDSELSTCYLFLVLYNTHPMLLFFKSQMHASYEVLASKHNF